MAERRGVGGGGVWGGGFATVHDEHGIDHRGQVIGGEPTSGAGRLALRLAPLRTSYGRQLRTGGLRRP